MSNQFELPTHDALLAEQELVQAEKFQGRLLAEYSRYIFPGQKWREPRGGALVDFVKPIVGDTGRASLEDVLAGMGRTITGRPVHWVDMGGGRALPMRQLGTDPDVRQKLRMTNVDLFRYGLEPDEVTFLEALAPGMTQSETEPLHITDNVETVTLPEPADIITSVEAMQYLNNPLEALVNWYNQLTDNGIMLVATEHDWASWIRYAREPRDIDRDETPVKHLLEELSAAGIAHAVTAESDWENGFRPKVEPDRTRVMAIQKKPGTSLRVNQPVTKVWVNLYNFKAVYYEVPTNETSPLIEVVVTDVRASLGATSFRNMS